jgi:hypothetical protein
MAITFNCPNGHRLSCPDQQGGKAGKCPKCGSVLRVPMPGAGVIAESAAGPRAPSDLGGTATTALDSPVAGLNELLSEEHDTTESADDDQIVFLCPNGHRLNSPVSLAGRPGQCPHCSAKFLIPSLEESLAAEDGDGGEHDEGGISLDEIVIQVDTSKAGLSAARNRASGSPPPSPRPPAVPVEAAGAESAAMRMPGPSATSAEQASLARLLRELWGWRGDGVTIEIHVGGGEPLVPDEFTMSDDGHALFSVRESDGTHTLSAVSWSAIERIVARGLTEFPTRWFR